MQAHGSFAQLVECDYMCFGCEAEEAIATIQLDASRVDLPPADEAGEAKTQHVLIYLFTPILYAVGLYYLLAPGPYQRPQ